MWGKRVKPSTHLFIIFIVTWVVGIVLIRTAILENTMFYNVPSALINTGTVSIIFRIFVKYGEDGGLIK